MLFELVTAANFMDIKPLLDLTCLAVSVYIKVSSSILLEIFLGNSLINGNRFVAGHTTKIS